MVVFGRIAYQMKDLVGLTFALFARPLVVHSHHLHVCVCGGGVLKCVTIRVMVSFLHLLRLPPPEKEKRKKKHEERNVEKIAWISESCFFPLLYLSLCVDARHVQRQGYSIDVLEASSFCSRLRWESGG